MLKKVYLEDGMRVFLYDSTYARDINSVLKDAELRINNDSSIRLKREDKEVTVDLDDLGLDEDECGCYLEIEGY
jgi:hypothetical protein